MISRFSICYFNKCNQRGSFYLAVISANVCAKIQSLFEVSTALYCNPMLLPFSIICEDRAGSSQTMPLFDGQIILLRKLLCFHHFSCSKAIEVEIFITAFSCPMYRSWHETPLQPHLSTSVSSLIQWVTLTLLSELCISFPVLHLNLRSITYPPLLCIPFQRCHLFSALFFDTVAPVCLLVPLFSSLGDVANETAVFS